MASAMVLVAGAAVVVVVGSIQARTIVVHGGAVDPVPSHQRRLDVVGESAVVALVQQVAQRHADHFIQTHNQQVS